MGDNASDVLMEEVLACSFDRWYEEFQDVTFASRAISLPEDFVQYLLADGVRVPVQADAASSDDSQWGDGGSDSEGSQHGANDLCFPEVEEAVRLAIADLDGSVLPKLNWSAPKDARWLFGTLQCRTVEDVFTLLKSSDFIAHDLCHSFDHCADRAGGRSRPDVFKLVLREWRAVDEASEFRCFVRERQLRAVSQRHTSLFFPHLVDPEFTGSVVQKIAQFFEERVRASFPLERYAFDVLLGKPPRLRVRLVDFSPWAPSTDPLLFDWEELRVPLAAGEPEFRSVEREGQGRAKLENYHAVPLEVAELGIASPEEMEELCRRAQGGAAGG
mmetsp:Transcript_60623/g.195288  ORF Transcript_60623/g.195288 Transcript_60623/m.195288 type:complete len:330 (+) Transcript_60623:103-1092(+)